MLIVVGLMASLYMPSSVIKLTANIYGGTLSPHNTGYLGTSSFIDLLRDLNYSIRIAETQEDFIRSLENRSLAIIIAPDREAPQPLISKLLQSFREGKINILIADENITSNSILRELAGIEVDGRAVFTYGVNMEGKRTPFPEAVMLPYLINGRYMSITYTIKQYLQGGEGVSRSFKLLIPLANIGRTYLLRLNWASFLIPSAISETPSWIKNYILLAFTSGYVDLDNDGRLQPDELNNQPVTFTSEGVRGLSSYAKLPTPLLIEGLGITTWRGNLLLVFSDSFPFTNQALTPKNSPYRAYLAKLLTNPSIPKEAVFCDCLYRRIPKTLRVPYHPAILMYFADLMLHMFDIKLNQAIHESPLISLSAATVLILTITLIVSRILGGKAYMNISPSEVEEVGIIAETEIKKSLLRGEARKKPREAIRSAWEILNYVLQRSLGYSADEIIRNGEILESTAEALSINAELLRSDLGWLKKIYRRASGKSALPPIIFWGRTLKKYLILCDRVLGYVGYTLLRRRGLRRVESILH